MIQALLVFGLLTLSVILVIWNRFLHYVMAAWVIAWTNDVYVKIAQCWVLKLSLVERYFGHWFAMSVQLRPPSASSKVTLSDQNCLYWALPPWWSVLTFRRAGGRQWPGCVAVSGRAPRRIRQLPSNRGTQPCAKLARRSPTGCLLTAPGAHDNEAPTMTRGWGVDDRLTGQWASQHGKIYNDSRQWHTNGLVLVTNL